MDNTAFLAGKWHITHTNFPMWLKGNKLHPKFNYGVTGKEGERTVFADEVSYEQNGKIKTIRGTDFPDAADANAFVWRGKGLLYLLKSRWKIALSDPAKEWCVIYFSKTLFTPEGMDIICRNSTLAEAQEQIIFKAIEKDELLKSQLKTLKALG